MPAVRGIYVSARAAGTTERLDALLDLVEGTEINAFVIDVKEAGEVSLRSEVPLAGEIGALGERIPDVAEVLRRVREAGVMPIARLAAFRDPVLAARRPEWSLRTSEGEPWRDGQGLAWLDPGSQGAREYNIALAREAAELGFAEIQWDYVRYPSMGTGVDSRPPLPAAAERREAVRGFVTASTDALADLDVIVTVDVFGYTTSAANDLGIGQLWEDLLDVADVIHPMVYPSHYPAGGLGIPDPVRSPHETVSRAMREAVRRTPAGEASERIRPWLQAFTLHGVPYGPEEIREQKRAVYESGLDGWFLWNSRSTYDAEALDPV
jgi:hypothetical protein